MATMNISLPDQMKAWVEKQSADGKYANTSDLIRREQIKQETIAAMNEKIEEANASGFSEKTIAQVFADVRKRVEP